MTVIADLALADACLDLAASADALAEAEADADAWRALAHEAIHFLAQMARSLATHQRALQDQALQIRALMGIVDMPPAEPWD